MGSGPSKDQKGKDTAREGRTEKPVANVNNRNTRANTEPQQQQQSAQKGTFITQPEDSIEDRNNSWNDNRNQNARGDGELFGRSSYDRSPAVEKQTTHTSGSVWRPDQESERELNEVLKIPTDNSRYSNRPVNTVTPVRQEDLPETYAQRKQREQYTLNQQMLIRQKTIYRDPKAWEQEDEEDEETHTGTGFDPNKFRSANYGQPATKKSTIFTTNADQDNSIQYMPGQRDNMDDFDVSARHKNMSQDLPKYNASEQDLMASLERELMM